MIVSTIRLRSVKAMLAGGLTLALCLTAVLFRPAAAVSARPAVSLPILMYHSLLPQETNQYTVSPQRFEADLQYLTAHGYRTVLMQEVIDYVHGTGTLPAKPVMITFDDGYYNNYYYAFPLLKQYRCKMVLSPIGFCSDQFSDTDDRSLSYAYVTWRQLREMTASGLVEIANHTYDLHSLKHGRKGVQKTSESSFEYRKLLMEDIGGMQQEFGACLGRIPTTFTYPYGASSPETLSLLKEMGFSATLTCTACLNRITGDPACLFELGRYLRPGGVDTDTFFTHTPGFT